MRWSNKKHKIKKHKPTASSPAEFNRFTYANNNPLSGKDIDGNKWIPYGRFSGQPISPNRVDVLNNIYEMEAGIMRQEEKLKRAMALIDAEWRDFVTGGTPVIYVDGIKLSDREANKLAQMGLSGLAWMYNASTIESYGITSIGSGSWINPAELFSDATSSGAWVRWNLVQSSEDDGNYTSTYVHPVTGETVTYTDNMLNVYVIESFVYASDFGTGSLAMGGGIGQGGGDWVNALDLGLELGELARQYKVYETYGVSAEIVENALKNGLYVHTNGKIYSQKFRGNQYISSKSVSNSISTAKFARNLGRGITLVGVGISLYQFGSSNQTGADYARLAGAAFITGSAFIPVVGPFISIGLGIADSFGAFDEIYNSFGH